MIQPGTRLKIADNTGAKIGACINTLKSQTRCPAAVGDVIVISVKSAIPNGNTKKKEVVKAVVVRQTKPIRRKDGTVLRFDDNAVVIVNADKTPKGSRIFGPVAREIRDCGYSKIISLAPEVL